MANRKNLWPYCLASAIKDVSFAWVMEESRFLSVDLAKDKVLRIGRVVSVFSCFAGIVMIFLGLLSLIEVGLAKPTSIRLSKPKKIITIPAKQEKTLTTRPMRSTLSLARSTDKNLLSSITHANETSFIALARQ